MIFNLNYFLIIGEALLFRDLVSRKYKDAWKLFAVVTFVQLALIASLRDVSVGIDTQNYVGMFLDAQDGIITDYIEWGSRLYILFLGGVTRNDTIFLAAWAVPTIALFYRYMVRNSKDVYLSVCIYASLMYYFIVFNMIRQALAIGIVLQAIEPLQERKYLRYLLIVLLAVMIHTSAAVFLLTLPMSFVRIQPGVKTGILVTVLCAIVSIAGRGLIEFGTGLIGYGGYLNSGFAGEGNILHPMLFLSLLMLCSVLLQRRGRNRERRYPIEYWMFAVGTLFYWLSVQVQIVNRIPYYFTGSILVMFPNLIQEIHDRKQAEILKLAVMIFLILYEMMMVWRSAQGIVPYSFFFASGR